MDRPDSEDKYKYDVLISGSTYKITLVNTDYSVDDEVELEIPNNNWTEIRSGKNNVIVKLRPKSIKYGKSIEIPSTEDSKLFKSEITIVFSNFEKQIAKQRKSPANTNEDLLDKYGNIVYQDNIVPDITEVITVTTDKNDNILSLEYQDSTEEIPKICKIIVEKEGE